MVSPRVLSERDAIDAIQNYHRNHLEGTVQFALPENPSSTLEYKISWVGEKAIAKLSLFKGTEEDWNRLKVLATRLKEKEIPIRIIHAFGGYKNAEGEIIHIYSTLIRS